jgi:hypothetical protein
MKKTSSSSWPKGSLKLVSRESYDAVNRARGVDFMTGEEKLAAARSLDEMSGRCPKG